MDFCFSSFVAASGLAEIVVDKGCNLATPDGCGAATQQLLEAHGCRPHPEDYLKSISTVDVFAFPELLHHSLHKLQIYLVPILITPCR